MYVCVSDNIWYDSIFLSFCLFSLSLYLYSPVFTCIAATAVFDIRFDCLFHAMY